MDKQGCWNCANSHKWDTCKYCSSIKHDRWKKRGAAYKISQAISAWVLTIWGQTFVSILVLVLILSIIYIFTRG